MKIQTTALMSVILVLTTFSAMSMPTFDVNVANFPLDEEGNLRVTQMIGEQNVTVTNLPVDEQGNLKIAIQPISKVITLLENQSFSVTVGDPYKLLCEANVEGWRKVVAYIYWSSKLPKADVSPLHYIFNYRTSDIPSMIIHTSAPFSFGSDEQAVSLVDINEIRGSILGIWVAGSGTTGYVFQADVTVSLYITR